MRTTRIANRQNMRQQNATLKKMFAEANTLNRGFQELEKSFHKGYTMGFEAGVASVSKQEVSDAAK